MLAEDRSAEGLLDVSAPEFELENRLERLVHRVMEGLCVPFLGAGISMGASASTDNPPTLNASKIAKNLAKKLGEHLQTISNVADGHPRKSLRNLGLHCAKLKDDGTFEKDGQGNELVPSLGEVSELCWSVLKPTGTCEVLELERWSELLPTAAHHYLAVLVREGLITEVLETNYDEFVERAVQETFGSDGVSFEPGKSFAPVISDLSSYRDHIASPRDELNRRALVKVVKLNGCAAAYQRKMSLLPAGDPKRDDVARRIVLTEEQLQDWGDKNWARELLNDRVRSRTLLFIGFGNADPLVRHHSVQVIREFQNGSRPSSLFGDIVGESNMRDQPWYQYKNAPFIAAYDANLTFYQYQVLRAFRDAHSSHTSFSANGVVDSQKQIEHVASVYANTFLGSDGPKLVPPAKRAGVKSGLPADVFLEVIAARCLGRLAREKWFSPNSPLHSYLQGALLHPRTLLAEICQILFSSSLDSPALFSNWLRLQRPTTREQRASPWATACFAIRGHNPARGGYRPFLDSPIKQTMLIVLMVLLAQRDESGRLLIPSGEDLIARAGKFPSLPAAVSNRTRRPAYLLVAPERENGTRAVFATSSIDGFLYGDGGVHRVDNAEDMIPDHALVIGLGRGNVGAFRRQIWLEVRQPSLHDSTTAAGVSDGSSRDDGRSLDGAPRQVAGVEPVVGVRAVREVYVIGDLAAIRGGDSQSVDLIKARNNLKALARMPESFLGTSGGWHRYCQEIV
ncbi:hypothetical protein F0U59_15830 [Archangium gephyra]|nr:hypothetical protein F0U59_15830 [Archangium gephyra]